MASIRRTLSPGFADRHKFNGASGSPVSISASSQRFLAAAVKSTGFYARRKGFMGWKSLYWCLLCFLVGVVLGFSSLGHVDRESLDEVASSTGGRDFPLTEVQTNSKGSDELTINAVSLLEQREELEDLPPPKKLLIIVTPTYPRATQAYFLTRLGQLLRLVPPPLLWLVVETGEGVTPETVELLRKTGLMYRHLVTGPRKTTSKEAIKDRGVHQRNAALEHIEKHRLDGIVYFADDDNVYSLDLFTQLRDINRFGTWPVAMVAQSKNKAILEGPVCNGSQVIGWHTNEKSKRLRRFHVDMSGFAFNSTILWDPKRFGRLSSTPIRQLDTVKEGFQETTFIEQVVKDEREMEGIPSGCSRIMNWHLHLDVHGSYPHGWLLKKNLELNRPIE